jgi:melibiose permease/lactose/raffinose/galactose permease
MNQLMLIAVIGYAVMLLPALILKTGAVTLLGLDLKFICITLGYMLANFGQYGFYLIMMISIMNTVEYNEEKFGIRDEGIISSLRPFLTKLASAITIAIANLTYIAFHLLNYTNGIAEQEQIANQKLIEISPQAEELGNQIVAEKEAAISTLLQDVQHWQSHALLLVMTLVPCLLMFLSFLLYKKHYTLDEPEYERICRELEARKEKVEAQ